MSKGLTVASSVVSTSPAPAAGGGAGPGQWHERLWARARSAPFLSSLIVCIVLAALSAAILPTVPSYDPWSWIVWGREVSDPHLSFIVNGGPSWKPLPVIFTTIYGLFGGAAPTLWVITERVGGLMAFAGAYRLAAMLVSRLGYGHAAPDGAPASAAGLAGAAGPAGAVEQAGAAGPAGAVERAGAPWPARIAAPLAGLIAAASLVLTQDWAYYWFRGASEPVLVGCALWAVERLIAGRRWQAFALGVALGLMRPEAWPLMIVFGGWLALREPTVRVRLGVLAGLVAMPLLWFAPPGISTGQPFLAATHASSYNGHLGAHPFLEVLRRGVDDQSLPVLLLAVIALAITLYRERDRLILWIAGGIAAWWVIVVAMTVDGYPGLERFYLPAAALTCVLAGVGVVRIGALAAELVMGAGARARGLASPVAAAAAVAAVAISVVFVSGRIDYARAQEPLARHAVTRLDQLSAAVAAVGGHRGVYPCRSSFAAINHSVQTALAWKLHVTLERVGTAMKYPGLLFVGPHDSIDGSKAPINPYFNRRELIKQVGPWRIYRVYRYGHPMGCIGG